MKRGLQWIVLIAVVFLIINLSRTLLDLMERGKIVDKAKETLAEVRSDNESLRREFDTTQDPFFVEQQAREKLNLAREGEIVAIIPQPTQLPPVPTESPIVPWQEWAEVFRLK